jgi:hypothetical protein
VRAFSCSKVADAGKQAAQTAGIVEVLHQEFSRGTDVGEERRPPREDVETVEVEAHAGAPGHRDEMHDGVRRSPQRHRHGDRVAEGLRRQQVAGPQVLPDHLDDPPAAPRSEARMVRVRGRDRRPPGQRHAEDLGRGSHRGSRAHGHARAEGPRDAVLDLAPRAVVEPSRALLGPVLPGVAAAAQDLAAFGDVGKGAFYGPSFHNWDVGLVKNTRLNGRLNLQFRAEAFNVFNHANFEFPKSGDTTGRNVSGGGFGRISSARDPRIIQFGVKLEF